MSGSGVDAAEVHAGFRELHERLGWGSRVYALGFGPKETCGVPTATDAFRLYVTRKHPRAALSATARLPRNICGVPVDVVEDAVPIVHAGGVLTARRRPVEMGDGISHEEVLNGSMGAVVRWEGRPGRYLLSCAHVLAPAGLGNRRDWVYQPEVAEGGRVRNNRIGRLVAWTRIRFGAHENTVDAALAHIEPDEDAVVNEIGIADVALKARHYLTQPEAEQRRVTGPVVKRGRTTGITSGRVVDWAWTGRIRVYDSRGRLRSARFRGQLRVKGAGDRPFSSPGDSGAVVVERGSSKMVGMVIAGSTTASIVTPAWRVLNVSNQWKVDLAEPQAPLGGP